MARTWMMAAFAVLLTVVPVAQAQDNPEFNPDLRDILRQLAENDSLFRSQMDDAVRKYGPNSEEVRDLKQSQAIADSDNVALLKALVRQHGWPGKDQVGEQTANRTVKLLLHADPGTQDELLPMVRQAARHREVDPRAAAVVEDRIRMERGKPQLYGTQVVAGQRGQEYRVYPVEDPSDVNQRRKALGLPPMEEELSPYGLSWEEGNAEPEEMVNEGQGQTEEPVLAPQPVAGPDTLGRPAASARQDTVRVNGRTVVTAPDSTAAPDTTKSGNW